jgi:hypothetical protein
MLLYSGTKRDEFLQTRSDRSSFPIVNVLREETQTDRPAKPATRQKLSNAEKERWVRMVFEETARG